MEKIGNYIVHTDRLPETVIGPVVRAEAAKVTLAPGSIVEYGLNKPFAYYNETTGERLDYFVSWWISPPPVWPKELQPVESRAK